MKENILITGSGFLATATMKRLVAENRSCLSLLARNKPLDPLLLELLEQGVVTFIHTDLRDTEKLRRYAAELGKVTGLIHLASAIPEFVSPDLLYCARENIENNVLGTIHLIESLKDVKHICFSSSVSVYSQSVSNTNVTEETPTSPETWYGFSKIIVEKLLQQFAQTQKIPITILRFTQLYGPNEPHDMFVTRLIKDARQGKMTLKGVDDIRDILFIDDAAEAVTLALEKKPSGIYNIASGRGCSIKDLAEEIRTHFPPTIQIVLEKQPAEPTHRVYAIEKAKKAFGFCPQHNLGQGIRKTVESVKKDDSS